MSFPATLDSLKNNWIPGETRDSHSASHNSIANLLLAIQTKIGITGSADISSIQYFIDNHDHSDFYTKTEVDSVLAGKQTTLGFAPENSASKGMASGYASLDAGGKVPASQLNLALIGKYVRTTTMGEAIASAGYGSNVTKAFALPGALTGTFSVMGGRVRFDVRTKIISASWKTNAINASGAMIIQSDAAVVLSTTPIANGTKIASGINFVCEPGVYYQIGVNSTANFGARGERALTAQEVAEGFVTGCYNNGNFDALWRLDEVVYQRETPSMVAVSVVGRVQHDHGAFASSAVANIARMGVRFSVPVACKLWEVRSYINATTGTASFLLLDATGATLATGAVASGQKTTTFSGYQLAANTEYRLVMNDTGNFGTTYYYSTVATIQANFGYALSGISGAGAGTIDNTNIGGPIYIELDFENKAYVSRANRYTDAGFCLVDGFVSAPKNLGDSVTLEADSGSVISGMNGLIKGQSYYLQNSLGGLATAAGTVPIALGVARSTTDLQITSYGFPERLIMNQPVFNPLASTVCYTLNKFPVLEGSIRYTLTANVSPNNGMVLQWSETGEATGPWIDLNIAVGTTVTDQRINVKKGFLRGKEFVPANPGFTATYTVYQ